MSKNVHLEADFRDQMDVFCPLNEETVTVQHQPHQTQRPHGRQHQPRHQRWPSGALTVGKTTSSSGMKRSSPDNERMHSPRCDTQPSTWTDYPHLAGKTSGIWPMKPARLDFWPTSRVLGGRKV